MSEENREKGRESLYLHDIPLSQAWERLEAALEQAGLWNPLSSEEIALEDGLGRVTARAVWARVSAPHYHAAAMDGYALRSADTHGATDRNPVRLQIVDQARYVDTGDPLPDWADAVVPIEDVEPVGRVENQRAQEAVRLRASVAPWAHVRPMGEDMVATELVLPAGQALRPVDLGAVAGSGHEAVVVWRKPRVAIIPTGSELVEPGSDLSPGEIVEYNSLVLAAQVRTWGGEATRYPIIADDLAQIKAAAAEAVRQHDLILIIAGSSTGSEDYSAEVVRDLGRVLVHGIAVRPGHPVILGMLDRRRGGEAEDPKDGGQGQGGTSVPVIGVPGYPVSAALTGEIFVEPLLSKWQGKAPVQPEQVNAVLTRKVHSSLGDDEYLRVTVGRVGDRLVAAPLSRGAGVISSLVRADGIVLIPAGVQGVQAGEEVDVRLYRTLAEVERTLVVLGSHDLTIDLMAQHLAMRGVRVSSANLGSLGGLIALRRGEAHFAGSHLLDPESGEYNQAYIERYLPDTPVVVMGWVHREQGLILPNGNPKGLSGLEDLAGGEVHYVNRQRGAGTRVLLDYQLDRLGIQSDTIPGYEHEEYSHLTVAATVASGRADCGLGIRAAAVALNLDFVPLFHERYDLVIPRRHFEHSKMQPLRDLLQEEDFRRDVMTLPGYDTEPMGTLIAELG
jgi:putative molybdopterin biosynthesis protein